MARLCRRIGSMQSGRQIGSGRQIDMQHKRLINDHFRNENRFVASKPTQFIEYMATVVCINLTTHGDNTCDRRYFAVHVNV